MHKTLEKYSPKENIIIKGAQLHNLKNIDVVIPRNQLVVITGLSGSGKSSLAFDTLYAEGQRRYVESLSSYARQFLGRLNKPKVEYIKGIAPAVAIEQKVNSTNPRSTVGTSTEIYDYIKLLFSRIGKTYSPISNEQVKKDTVSDVIDYIKTLPLKTKLLLLTPINSNNDRTIDEHIKILHQQGYSRIALDDKIIRIDQFSSESSFKDIYLVIDRIVVTQEEAFFNRVADAVQLAFYEGKGKCFLKNISTNDLQPFSNQFELDNIKFVEPTPHLFSFNNPYGACPVCEGYGDIVGIDPELVIPNSSLSVYENAIAPWKGETLGWYKDQLVNNAHKFNFPIHRPIYELSDDEKELIWKGNSYFIKVLKNV